MGASVGGQSGSQNGFTSNQGAFNNTGTQNGTSNATTNGTQTGTQSGVQTGTQSGQTTGYTGVDTTGIYNNAGAGAAGALNGSGLTSGQQFATDALHGVVENQPMGFALAGLNDTLKANQGAPTPVIDPRLVQGTTAASFMAPYQQSYANDVLNPSLAAFDQGTAIQANANRARRDAGSAFGDRAAVADSLFNTQQNTARGALAGQLTGQGWQSALGAGQSDASNGMSANLTNSANDLSAQSTNASNVMQGRAQDLASSAQQANNFGNINSMGVGNAQALYGASGGGLNNLLALMGSQVPAFGTSSGGATTGTSSVASA